MLNFLTTEDNEKWLVARKKKLLTAYTKALNSGADEEELRQLYIVKQEFLMVYEADLKRLGLIGEEV